MRILGGEVGFIRLYRGSERGGKAPQIGTVAQQSKLWQLYFILGSGRGRDLFFISMIDIDPKIYYDQS